jgi:hypothetical protein
MFGDRARNDRRTDREYQRKEEQSGQRMPLAAIVTHFSKGLLPESRAIILAAR